MLHFHAHLLPKPCLRLSTNLCSRIEAERLYCMVVLSLGGGWIREVPKIAWFRDRGSNWLCWKPEGFLLDLPYASKYEVNLTPLRQIHPVSVSWQWQVVDFGIKRGRTRCRSILWLKIVFRNKPDASDVFGMYVQLPTMLWFQGSSSYSPERISCPVGFWSVPVRLGCRLDAPSWPQITWGNIASNEV